MALDCIDGDNHKLFEDKHQSEEFPKYETLVDCIQKRCKVLELSEPANTLRSSLPTPNFASRPQKVLTSFAEGNTGSAKHKLNSSRSTPIRYNCLKCGGNPPLFRCYVFKNLSPPNRLDFLSKGQICQNCLRNGHSINNCPSTTTYFRCNAMHHTLIHNVVSRPSTAPCILSNKQKSNSPSSQPSSTTSYQQPDVVGSTSGATSVLLGTAVVHVGDWKGHWHNIRLIIDSGSQFSVMTTDCARRLGLSWTPNRQELSGVGMTQLPKSKGIVNCKISPIMDSTKVIDAIFNPTTANLNPSLKNNFRDIPLADETFWEPRPVDFLHGSDLFLEIITPQFKLSDKFGAILTIFGPVVLGIAPEPSSEMEGVCLGVTKQPSTDALLRRFWEMEEVPNIELSHPDDIACEEHFKNTEKRLPTGRLMVALPLRDTQLSFSGSRFFAMNRLCNLETKFRKQPIFEQHYRDFMQDYLQLEHMEVAGKESAYVIPHLAVFKANPDPGTPDKIRVVFDASMKAGLKSLNENFLCGPKLQRDISVILSKFRLHKIAFCADIVKMFRQIQILPEHRKFQHIFIFSPKDAITTYELKTLTYGQTSSPYLALRVLNQFAEDEGDHFSAAAEVLKKDVYVDDVITGANSLQEAIQLENEIVSLLQKGCLSLSYNSPNGQIK